MKLHVPANFIGYGTFALSAMVAFAYLIKQQAGETRWYKLTPLWLLGVALCFVPIAFRQRGWPRRAAATGWVYALISALDRRRASCWAASASRRGCRRSRCWTT